MARRRARPTAAKSPFAAADSGKVAVRRGDTWSVLDGHRDTVGWAAFDTHGYLFSGDQHGLLLRRDLQGREMQRAVVAGAVRNILPLAAGGAAFVEAAKSTSSVGQWPTEGPIQILACSPAPFIALAPQMEGGFYTAGYVVPGAAGRIRRYAADGAPQDDLTPAPQFSVAALAASADGKYLASGSGLPVATTPDEIEVLLWDCSTGERKRLSGHNWHPQCLAFSADGTRLATAGLDRRVIVWDTATGRLLITLTVDTEAVTGLAFDPAGTLHGVDRDGRFHSWPGRPDASAKRR